MGDSGNWLPYRRPSSATLEFVNTVEFTGYVMTAGNGTRTYYPSNEITPTGNQNNNLGYIRRSMNKVVYPNGFTIDIATSGNTGGPLYSVRTNTGFQLKYDFTGSWTYNMPFRVTALNNAVERCGHDSSPCTPGSNWPFATYTWPIGGPNIADLYQSLSVPGIFRVQDAEGRVTDYHHAPHEHESTITHPRIVRVDKDDDVVMNYSHSINSQDITFVLSQPFITPFQTASPIKAWVSGGGSQNYGHISPRYYYTLIGYEKRADSGPGRINLVRTTKYGAMERIESWEQTVDFYYEWIDDATENKKFVENYVESVHQNAGDITVTFYYDSRGNIRQRYENGTVTGTAWYPSSCTSSNFRYCNKPEWIEDANGNRTNFYYHAPSGQISLRVSPQGHPHGYAKTYYEYDEYYAHYKIDSETIEAAETPIWLLSQETHCQTSAMITNGVCTGGDEVVTTYEYDYHNLFLIGVAVTAKNSEGVTETRRTCYEYDVYGNKIGETSPRANLASCQ
jgi:hypothetical protein